MIGKVVYCIDLFTELQLFLSLAYLYYFPSPALVKKCCKILEYLIKSYFMYPHAMQNLNCGNRVEYFIISTYLNKTLQKLISFLITLYGIELEFIT